VLDVKAVRHGAGDAGLAQAAVGVDARVDELDGLSDALGGAGGSERVDTAAIELAEGVPAAVAVLVDRMQLSPSGEPCLLFVLWTSRRLPFHGVIGPSSPSRQAFVVWNRSD